MGINLLGSVFVGVGDLPGLVDGPPEPLVEARDGQRAQDDHHEHHAALLALVVFGLSGPR